VALAGQPNPGDAERLAELGTALRAYGDPRVDVVVVAGARDAFRLALRVAVDRAHEEDTVLAGVEAALRAAYSFEARGFAQPVHRSEVIAVVHGVAGVVAVDVDRLYSGAAPGLADRLVAKRPAVGPTGLPLPAGLLLLDPAPLDWLEALP
jgi:hypothetical protein